MSWKLGFKPFYPENFKTLFNKVRNYLLPQTINLWWASTSLTAVLADLKNLIS